MGFWRWWWRGEQTEQERCNASLIGAKGSVRLPTNVKSNPMVERYVPKPQSGRSDEGNYR